MAQGYVNSRYGQAYRAYSAGMDPTRVHPYAIKAMSEMGIDISHQKSKGIGEFLDREIDLAITVCDQAREACPFFGGAREMEHRGFRNPVPENGKEVSMDVFRQVRDEIVNWIDGRFGP